jgi:hypothetical protein
MLVPNSGLFCDAVLACERNLLVARYANHRRLFGNFPLTALAEETDYLRMMIVLKYYRLFGDTVLAPIAKKV